MTTTRYEISKEHFRSLQAAGQLENIGCETTYYHYPNGRPESAEAEQPASTEAEPATQDAPQQVKNNILRSPGDMLSLSPDWEKRRTLLPRFGQKALELVVEIMAEEEGVIKSSGLARLLEARFALQEREEPINRSRCSQNIGFMLNHGILLQNVEDPYVPVLDTPPVVQQQAQPNLFDVSARQAASQAVGT